jgi:hypothetical protein
VVAVGRLGGAAAVGMAAVLPSGTVASLGASDDRVHDLRAIEQALGRGPELEAAHVGSASSPDLLVERRWPVYASRARELGLRVVEAVQAQADHHGVVVTLWSPARLAADAAETAAAVLAQALASQVALERAAVEREEMRRGLDTRAVIGQAVGILMERLRVGADSGFGILREVSQRRNVKLRDVAEHLVCTGELLFGEAGPAPAALRCLVCRAPLPTDLVRVGGGDQGLAYTCPHCGKSVEFAPVSVLADRRADVARRRAAAREGSSPSS